MKGKFVEFKQDVVGDDGYTYYTGIKYGIQDEDNDVFYLVGKKKNSINKFIKQDIKSIGIFGTVVKEFFRK